LSLPGWIYEFPRDHFAHPEFKTEWWYFTGNIRDESGRRFGYQLTFFRQGIRPPAVRGETTSRFICDELKFAHFAISDPSGQRFRYVQKTSRGAFGEAGFSQGDRVAWIDEWNLQLVPGGMRLAARADELSIALDVKSAEALDRAWREWRQSESCRRRARHSLLLRYPSADVGATRHTRT
jgi:predicted secreted hydrolase